MALNRSFDQAGVYCLYYVRSGNDTVVNITRHVTKIQLVYKDTYTSSDLEGPNHEDNSQQMYMIVVGIVTVVALVIAIAILYRNRRRKKTNDVSTYFYTLNPDM
uniref:SFRICE_038820 n=1 Tax=Spodoptera frugiperda TaxID=7108 RepID=A0A2H1X377_SPOFR